MELGVVGEHNGQRLARARQRRRWTQDRLALEAGYSVSAIRAFEQGRRSLDNMRQLLAFARALEVPVTDLTGQPYMPADPGQDAGHGAVAAIRRELLLAERAPRITDTDAAAVSSVSALRARVADVHAKHRLAALRGMGDDLPDLLHDLRVACHVPPAADCPVVYRLRARAYEAAMDMLKQTGYVADATAAITKGQYSRERLARHWVDVARAYHYRADYDRALPALLKADRLAAVRTRIEPGAREVVGHMLRVRRKGELVELGLRMGVI